MRRQYQRTNSLRVGILPKQRLVGVDHLVIGVISANYPFGRTRCSLEPEFLRQGFDFALCALAEDFERRPAPVIGGIALHAVEAGQRDEADVGRKIELEHTPQAEEIAVFGIGAIDAGPPANILRTFVKRLPIGRVAGPVIGIRLDELRQARSVEHAENRPVRRIGVGREADGLRGQRIGFIDPDVGGELDPHVGSWLCGNGQATAVAFHLALPLVTAHALLPAFPAPFRTPCGAHGQRVAQRHVEVTFGIEGFLASEFHRDTAIEIAEFGLRRDEIHQPAGRIPAIKRALRPLQNLDAFKVEHRPAVHEGIGERNFVLICPDGRCGREVDGIEPDPAQRVDRDTLIAARDIEAGDHHLEVFGRIHLQIVELFSGEGLDRHANIGNRFLAAVGGHDDHVPLGAL